MKNLFKTLSLIGLSLSLSVTAQTSSNKAKFQAGSQSVPQNEAKSAFINSQEYLSPNSTSGYFSNYYGDSLKGFDEAKIKKDILAKGLPGWEAQIYLLRLKREFINNKYSIGAKPNLLPPLSTPSSNNNSSGNKSGKTVGSGSGVVNIYPCVNEDFESSTAGAYTTSTGVSGWTISSRSNDGSCSPTNWTAGSTQFWIVSTPILSWGSVGSIMGVIPNSPLGGSNVAQLGDQVNDLSMVRIAQTFPVTSANTLFQIAYAGYWQDGGSGHSCCPVSNDQPGLNLKMYDCTGAPLSCSALSLSPGSGCQSSGVTYTTTGSASWCNWIVKFIDLTPYVGSCVTIEIIDADCAFGGHWGSTLFDARCGGQLVGTGLGGVGGSIGGPVSFCAGSNQAIIAAPIGYSSYQWFAPTGSIAAPQGTMSQLTVTNPIPGTVYTVQLIAPSGCIFTSTNAIAFSTITIAGVGTTTTCAGGASGSATVAGNGSGTGYNYTWINALTTATVGTTAIVSSLAPGTYSVILTALGSAGCGSAVTTVTVSTGPPGIIPLLKPFCGTEAYLGPHVGSNYHWYNGSTAIPAPLGTAPGYTVQNPVQGQIYWLSYLSSQGCQDSVQYTLVSSPPGLMSVSNISKICVGGSNGTATISLSPAAGAPPGLNYYWVASTGTTPAYQSTLGPTGINTYTFGGLSAGNYSVNVFDGSCKYTTTFALAPYTFSFGLSTTSATLCPGNSVNSSLTWTIPPGPGQFTYVWSPTTYLIGSTSSNAIITPNLPVGVTSTIIYTVTATPTIVNCPVSHTMAITGVNPPIPSFTVVPPLCNTSAPYQILASPSNGTFAAATPFTSTNNPLTSSGIITPSLAVLTPTSNSVYAFNYSISVLGCKASNSSTYQVSHFNTAALTSSVPPLCVTSPLFNLMNIVQSSAGGSWKATNPTPLSSVVGGTQFNPAGLPTNTYIITYSTQSSPNVSACPDVTTTIVHVTNTILPTFQAIPELCTKDPTVSIIASPVGGGWLPNNGAVSSSGVVNPQLVSVPGMTVTYTVQIGPCLNSNNFVLTASRFNSAALSGVLNPLCFNSGPVNLMSVVQSTIAGGNGTSAWSVVSPAAAASAITSNSFFPSPQLPTGYYTLQYNTTSWPNPNRCPDVSTISVYLLNPPTPTITQVNPMCNNASPVQMSVTPNSGHWTSATYLSTSGMFNPSLASVGNNAITYVVGTSTCNVHDTKVISIEAFVPATVSSKIPDLCSTSPVIDLSPMAMNAGIWSGPGITGSNFDPASTGSGHFTLMHSTASSPSGLCPDQALITVNVYSLATPHINQAGPLCNNADPFELVVTPVGGLFSGSSAGSVSGAGKFNPGAAIIGDNVINYSITAGPCVAYAQTTIRIEKFISADFGSAKVGPFCKTNNPVDMNSYVQNPGGNWETSQNTPGLSGSMFNPATANIIGTGTNFVIHRTNSSPLGLCPDSAGVLIEVRDVPVVTAMVTSNQGCVPFEVGFYSPNVNDGEAIWSINDGSEKLNGIAISHVFSVPGTYDIQLNYTDAIGCKAIPVKTQQVFAREVPKADFTFPDDVYINEPQIQLVNQTTVLSNNTYQWTIGNSVVPQTEVSPVVTFPKIGKYQVTLTATSIYGCKDEVSKTIEVKNVYNVFIPNSFTPNFDGLNDYFMPVFSKEGIDLKSFEMEIFDRWGHSLYHTKDALSKGWDGSIQNKGEPLKEEVYVYRIKYKDSDGNAYNKMGHLSLIK